MEKQEEIFSFQEKFDHSGIERDFNAAAFASSFYLISQPNVSTQQFL